MSKAQADGAARIRWYASGGGIAQCGPFSTEREAREAMQLTPEAAKAQRKLYGTCSPYPYDLVVWPEYGSEKR